MSDFIFSNSPDEENGCPKGDAVGKNFFKETEPCLRERLGRVYMNDEEYRESARKEAEYIGRMEKAFTESQFEMVRECHILQYGTLGICEMLAYRQGMRDMAEILGCETRGGACCSRQGMGGRTWEF
ncbi:MAG: hypothetical protein NC548_25320 [Lachnospiraceae bacterium]|nr:hypothetical protein [Lachnospiraceae bacterium]